MMSETAAPPASIVSNAASSVCTVSGRRRIRTVIFVTTASVPSEPTSSAEQIRTWRVHERAADVHELAVRKHRLDPEDVMHGEAVLQAVRAAGILGDVAADRADLLAGRIRRVVVTERRHLTRDLEVGDAGLDGDALVRDVDVQDPIEARQRDHDAARHRQRAAGQAGAVSARHERHPVARAQLDDRLNLRRRIAGALPPRATREGAAARRTRT